MGRRGDGRRALLLRGRAPMRQRTPDRLEAHLSRESTEDATNRGRKVSRPRTASGLWPGLYSARRAARSFFLEKRVLNLIVNALQPFFRAYSAITEMCGLDLKRSRPFFCGSKLR
jgi:hypothetical protein